EQRLVARLAAGRAEIVRRSDKTLSEQPLPDAVHHHARRERIAAGQHPFSQLAPAAAGGGDFRGRRVREHGEKTARNFLAWVVHVAALENRGLVDDPKLGWPGEAAIAFEEAGGDRLIRRAVLVARRLAPARPTFF